MSPTSVEGGIEAVRNLLPRAWIDAEELRARAGGAAPMPARIPRAPRRLQAAPAARLDQPRADALRYLAVGLREAAGEGQPPLKYQDRWVV